MQGEAAGRRCSLQDVASDTCASRKLALAGGVVFLEKSFDGQRSWKVVRARAWGAAADPDILQLGPWDTLAEPSRPSPRQL